MKQKEIIKYYENNGGLRCKDWSLSEIKARIKSDFGKHQRVYEDTCRELRNEARMYQR